MNPMLPNLTGNKMSATHAASTKIMILDAPEEIARKMQAAPWQTDASKNAFLMTLRDILVPLSELHQRPGARVVADWENPCVAAGAPDGTRFSVTAQSGVLHFGSYADVHQALGDGRLDIDDLRVSVAEAVTKLLAPARVAAETDTAWQIAEAGAYPSSS